MPGARTSKAAIGALVCAAAASWVSRGALTFLGPDAPGQRAGILPSPAWLAVALMVAVATAVVLRPSSRTVAPLWLSAVLLLPWLPLPLPAAVFAWAGHLVSWVWTAIAVMLVAASPARDARLSARLAALPARRAAALAAACSVAIFALVAWRTAPRHPSGDEPHYLVMTQSLLNDGDLQIENNHAQRDFAAYFNGELPPDYVRRGQNGAIYSSHAPGLAVLVLPVFAVFGYPGTVVMLALLSAITMGLVWTVTWRVTGRAASSWFAWAVMLSAPVILLTNAVFPDGVAPLLITVGLLPLVHDRARTPRYLLLVGAALTLLPWLHTRLAILAGSLGVVILARLVREPARWPRIAAFLALPVPGAVGWLAFFWVVYGTPNPTAAIGKELVAPLMSQGLTGLLLDQRFGLLIAAPVMWCAAAAVIGLLVSGPRRLAVEGIVIILPYALTVAAWDMWWGGSSPPARFLVPVAPVLAVAAGLFVSKPHSAAVRAAVGASLAMSLIISATMVWVGQGAMIFSDRTDLSPLLSWLSPVVDLTGALPDAFSDAPALVLAQGVVWLLVLGGAWAFARSDRFLPSPVRFGLAGQLLLMVALTVTWAVHARAVEKPFEGARVVVNHLEPGGSQLGVTLPRLHSTRAARVAAAIPLARVRPAQDGATSFSTGPLPPGTYELRYSSRPTTTAAVVTVRTDARAPALRTWDLHNQPAGSSPRLVVPVQVPGLRVELDAAASAAVQEMSVRIVAAARRSGVPFPGVEAGHGAGYGAVSIYYMSGRSWLEGTGLWVAARDGAEFAIAQDGRAPVRLLLRNGPHANRVSLDSDGWHLDVDLEAGAERNIEVPASAKLSATPLRVVPATGFRPIDLDPSSADTRLLGVWIQPALASEAVGPCSPPCLPETARDR